MKKQNLVNDKMKKFGQSTFYSLGCVTVVLLKGEVLDIIL
jgi:hypothetical protein